MNLHISARCLIPPDNSAGRPGSLELRAVIKTVFYIPLCWLCMALAKRISSGNSWHTTFPYWPDGVLQIDVNRPDYSTWEPINQP